MDKAEVINELIKEVIGYNPDDGTSVTVAKIGSFKNGEIRGSREANTILISQRYSKFLTLSVLV